jgi:hypothetical protein
MDGQLVFSFTEQGLADGTELEVLQQYQRLSFSCSVVFLS